MKKYLLSFLMMAMGAVLVTSCLSDDNSDKNDSSTIVTTTGLYVINNGTWNQNNGSMTYFDYEKLTATQVLQGAGGLGDTPNDAYTKGDTIFVVGSTENTIFAIDKKNLNIIRQVSTTAEMGEAEGYNPRHITGYNNKLYFTTYGGYVGELDANSLSLTNKWKVGSAPEGIAIGGTSAAPILLVANSDYGYGNASVSKITISSDQVETITNDKIRNPQEILADENGFYFLDWGYYDENWNQKEAGLYYYVNSSKSVSKIISDATGMGVGLVYLNGYAVGYNIVTFNDPYGNTGKPTYTRFNSYTKTTDQLSLYGDTGMEIISPAAIAVDPVTGNIVIASRSKDPDTGYTSYTLPGYANMYSSEGRYIENSHFQTGIEPHMIGFTLGKVTINY
jgi:hypothetical protein